MKAPRSPLVHAAAFALVALACGCDSAPDWHPRTTQTRVLSPGVPSPDVEMGVISAIRVVLPGPYAGTGLEWEIGSNNNRVLEQMGPLNAVAPPGAPGSGPATAVSFYALRPGRSELRFYLVHPNQAEATPSAICRLVVRVTD